MSQDALALMLEYPIDWDADKNPYHKIFLQNIIQVIIKQHRKLLILPALWPSYGVKRESLANTILVAFHSYDNPENVWTLKESPIRGLYGLDKSGYSGWSDICKHYSLYQSHIDSISEEDAKKIVMVYKEKLQQGMTKYEQPIADNNLSLPKSFVFFPLQIRTDSVAENLYLDSLDVLDKVASEALKLEKYIVVKKHPFCTSAAVELKLLELEESNPFVMVSNSNVIDLIMKSEAVLSANSGVSLEALICGKPVFCFGKSEWATATHMIKNLAEVNKVFFEENYPKENIKLLAFLLSEYWVGYDDIEKINNKINELFNNFSYKTEDRGISSDYLNLYFEEKILKYQQQYTIKYNQLREIEKDYHHIKESTKTFSHYIKFKKSPFYYIFFYSREIVKRLFVK